MMAEYEFIGKATYFPKQKVLAIGDMHLGHEFTFRDTGSFIPATQLIETKKDLLVIFKQLEKEKKPIEKVVFLGDIKHFFSYEKGEKNIILEILLLVGEHVKREDIILSWYLNLFLPYSILSSLIIKSEKYTLLLNCNRNIYKFFMISMRITYIFNQR